MSTIATTLEDLPAELWMELFVYFTWEQLNLTWLEWKLNNRIQTLAQVAQSRVALEMSPTSFKTYSQSLNYFENEHSTIAYRITSLVLSEAILSNEIISRWLKNGASYFPRIRHCTVYFHLVSQYVQCNIIRLIHQNASTLRRVVLYFDRIKVYEQMLNKIIKRQISLHTMQLIFVRDDNCHWLPRDFSEYVTCNRELLTFSNTIHLRLSLQRISDLALLMQHGTLPRIEYLHVTLEKSPCFSYPWRHQDKNLTSSTLCSKDFNSNRAELTHLRTLHLQQVSISDVIVLIQNLTSMSQVESLALVNSDATDKNELMTFKSSIARYLVCLRNLQFMIFLPIETKLEKIDLYWFDLTHYGVEYEINEVIVLYTVPYMLNSQRKVYNHTFGRQPTINNKINHIQWTVDSRSLSINRTLAEFQYVHSLELYYDIKEMNPNPCSWQIVLPALRSVALNFDWNPRRNKDLNDSSLTSISNRCFILDQLRQCAPSLQCLTLWWHELRPFLKHSDSPWSSILQLNILLRAAERDNPSAAMIKRLSTNKAFPQLQYLTFGARRFQLKPPELVAERILSWLDALLSPTSKLVMLHVNRRCPYFRTRPSTAGDMLLMLLKQHDRLRNPHHRPAKIIIDSNEEIIIWL